MPRVDFDRDLRMLQDELLIVGSMVEKAIAKSLHALKNRDMETAHSVVEEDDIIDQKRLEIEERCIDLIATQQPLAGDLRILVTVLQIIGELERMGEEMSGEMEATR